jgi:hypothetical protein
MLYRKKEINFYDDYNKLNLTFQIMYTDAREAKRVCLGIAKYVALSTDWYSETSADSF